MIAAGGAGGSTTFEALQKADDLWYKLRHARVRVHSAETCCYKRTGNLTAAPVPREAHHQVLMTVSSVQSCMVRYYTDQVTNALNPINSIIVDVYTYVYTSALRRPELMLVRLPSS